MSQSSYFWIWGVERVSGRHVQLQCPAATARQAVARGEAEGLHVTGLAAGAPGPSDRHPGPAAQPAARPADPSRPASAADGGREPIVGSASTQGTPRAATAGRRDAGRPPSAGRISATSWIIVLVPVFTDLIMRATNPPPPPATIVGEAVGVYLVTFAVALTVSYIAWQIGRRRQQAADVGFCLGVGLLTLVVIAGAA